MPFSNCIRLLCTILILLTISSCKPSISYFRVSPLVITGDQKVSLEWDAKGTPAMEFNEHMSVDSVQLLEYTLIVTKAGKEARRTMQVQKMRSDASIEITFATNKMEGDTVIASGENNNNQWAGFQIVSVSSPMQREVAVSHSGRSATLNPGSSSSSLSGTNAGGEWIFKTKLTESEKSDRTKIPQELKIRAVIKPSTP